MQQFNEYDRTGAVLLEGTAITFLVFLIYTVFATPDNEFWLRAAVAIGYTIVAQAVGMAAVHLLRAAWHAVDLVRRRESADVPYTRVLRRAAFLSTYGALVFVYVRLSWAAA